MSDKETTPRNPGEASTKRADKTQGGVQRTSPGTKVSDGELARKTARHRFH